MLIRNSEGEGVSKAKIFKVKYKARVGGLEPKKLSLEEVWIFSGTTNRYPLRDFIHY